MLLLSGVPLLKRKKKDGLIQFKTLLETKNISILSKEKESKFKFLKSPADLSFYSNSTKEIIYKLWNGGLLEITFPINYSHNITLTAKESLNQGYNFLGIKDKEDAEEYIKSQYKIKPKELNLESIKIAFDIVKCLEFDTLIINENKVKLGKDIGEGVFEQKDYREFLNATIGLIERFNSIYGKIVISEKSNNTSAPE